MFSANENLLLRQHKRRVVGYVEATILESVLDLGVNVMVMQVNCTDPGCVPIETCIIIVFPTSRTELILGLPESAGGSYKTKVLKPMSEVTNDDVLNVLPPLFQGGRKPSAQELCLRLRDVMLGQITQVFGDMTVEGRTLVARYLQTSLDDYVRNDCEPPVWGGPFSIEANAVMTKAIDGDSTNRAENDTTPEASVAVIQSTAIGSTKSASVGKRSDDLVATATAVCDWTKSGNVVIRRPANDGDRITVVKQGDGDRVTVVKQAEPPKLSTVNSVAQKRRQQSAAIALYQQQSNSSSSTLLAQLSQREHLPGIRRPGCPCCDPDNLSTIVNTMMSQI